MTGKTTTTPPPQNVCDKSYGSEVCARTHLEVCGRWSIGNAGQDPGCPSVYYFSIVVVGLLLYSIMRRCALLSASQDNILQLHESYVVVAKGNTWAHSFHVPYRPVQYIYVFPSHAILLSKVFGRLKLASNGSYFIVMERKYTQFRNLCLHTAPTHILYI